MPAPDADPTPGSDSPETTPGQTPQARPGTPPSAPSASHYMPELPYAEELQALLEGKYIVESFLGQGGMGAVYRGLQLPLKRPVAIKILAKGQVGVEDDYAFEERFKREAYAMAALTHPNIVQVYDCGDAGENFLFISMELVDGGDMSDAIKNKLVTPEVALALIGPICDGLQAAHEHGLVHRDIKPANIFLTSEGKPKVADFGLAKKFDSKATMVTKTGLGMGTPDYAAPEQYEGVADIDHRADIYALGVMFYQMLTGSLPRGAYKPVSQRVPVDPRLDDVVTRAMESDREERYQNVAQMKADVEQIVATWMAAPQPAQAAAATSHVPLRTSAIPVHTGRVPVAHRPAAHAAPTHTAGVPTRRPAVPTAPVPEPAKSRTGIMIGVLGAIAAIAGGAFFLTKKPKPEPAANAPVAESSAASPTQVEDTSYAASPQGEQPASTAPPGSPRTDGFSSFAPNATWRSGFAPSEKWGNNWERVGTEMHVAEGKSGMFLFADEAVDCGVRVRFRNPRAGGFFDLILRLKKVGVGPRYVTSIRPGAEATGSIDLLPPKEQGPRLPITRFEKNPDASPGVEHTAEFYAVGEQLTFFFDGQQIATCRDGMLSAGFPGISAGQEMEVISVETATLEGMTPPPPARKGEVLTFGGHRYQLDTEKVTWMDAKRRAEAVGGHLATITSKEENEWVRDTFVKDLPKGPGLWIGGESAGTPGQWRWVTGEPFGFTQWLPGEPQNAEHEPALMFIHKEQGGLGWADLNLAGITSQDRRMGFVIEWDGEVPPAPAPPLAAEGTVNLLALVDVKRDAVRGEWEMTPEGLLLRGTPGVQLLEIMHMPPEEYDFEIEFTPISGSMESAQVVPMNSESMLWKLGCGGGFYTFGPFLDGKKWGERTEASVKRDQLPPNVRHRSLLQVRKGSIRAEFDGEEVLNWSGDFTRFKGEPGFELKNATHLGLGSWATEVVFHKAELRPASASPAALAAAPMPASAPAGTATSVGGSDPAQPTAPASQENAALIAADPLLSKLAEGFAARYGADAQQPFLTAVAALNKSYLANGVAPARAVAQAKGDLDAVTAFDDVKAKIERGEGVPAADPPGTPEPLKALRNTYRAALAKLESDRAQKAAPLYELYLRALDGYVMELTKASKIAEASKVQKLRDDLAERAKGEGTARQIAATAPANAPAAPPESPATDEVSPGGASSTQQLAEWVLSNRGNLAILESGGRRLDFKTGDKLPAGKLEIVEIHVWLDGVTDKSLAIFSAAKSVVILRLKGTKPHKLDFLRELPELRVLVVASPVVSRDSWPAIGGLSRLQYLEFLGKVEDDQIAQLTGLKELDKLMIEMAPKGTGFAGMKESRKLRFLLLGDNGSELTDEGVRVIASTFPDLVECVLGAWDHGAAISNEGIKSLLPLKSLTSLAVPGKRIDDASLETFAKLSSLQRLNLGGTGIKGTGLGALSVLGDLQYLSLRNSALTSAGLEEVAKLKRLNELGIEDTGVSDAAVKKLLEARPDLKVTR